MKTATRIRANPSGAGPCLGRAPIKRIGHKGAHSLAPGNTLASFEAGLAAGVDVIEFDVIRKRGRLVLAHSVLDAYRRECLQLKDGLAHLGEDRYAPVQFNVDLKLPGYEREALTLLREFDLTHRCLVSSQFVRSLDRVRAAEPRIAIGVSVGGFLARRLHRWDGGRLAELIAEQIRAGRFDALMAHHALVCDELVELIAAAGGEVYAWTVDDPTLIERLIALGVAGVTTNDPRMFARREAGNQRAAAGTPSRRWPRRPGRAEAG
jgi:glycerophosphoryl diester phosphodiesterase